MIEAGSETTSMQLNNMLIGILSNPEVSKKAHEELDRVVGSERPPNFDDEPNLPYIRAIVKEVMRWRPINKFGQNHYATEVLIDSINLILGRLVRRLFHPQRFRRYDQLVGNSLRPSSLPRSPQIRPRAFRQFPSVIH